MPRARIALAVLFLPILSAHAEEPAALAPAVPERYVVTSPMRVAQALPFRPVRMHARCMQIERAWVQEIEGLAARLEGYQARAAQGETLGREEAAEMGRLKQALCDAVSRARREEALLTAGARARIAKARRVAGVCPGGGTAFAIEPDAVAEVERMLQTQRSSESWADARRVVKEWRILTAVAPLRDEARAGADRVETLARAVETQAELVGLGLRITGVIVDPSQPARSAALVNGYLLREGENVRPETGVALERIEMDRIWVRYRGELLALPAKYDTRPE